MSAVLTNNFMVSTRPETQEQENAYSLHAGERNAYSIASYIVQAVWAFTDSPSIAALLVNVATFFPAFAVFIPTLSGVLVLTLHYLLKETLNVSLYKILSNATWQDNEATNLQWRKYAKIPIIIATILYALSVSGLFLYEKQNGYKATITAPSSAELQSEVGTLDNTYSSLEKSILKKYKTKENATLSVSERKIANLEAIKPQNDWHKSKIAAEISDAKREKNAAIQKINADKTNELDALTTNKTVAIQSATSRHNSYATVITSTNDDEIQKQRVSERFGTHYSFVISAICVLIFLGVSFKLSEINYICNIMPIIKFSKHHGSLWEELKNVLHDIWWRRAQQFITFFHWLGTLGVSKVNKADGNVTVSQGTYNSATVLDNEAKQSKTPVITHTTGILIQNSDASAKDIITKLRTEISNVKVRNGTLVAVCKRADDYFTQLHSMVQNGELSSGVVITIGEKYEQYQQEVSKRKEVQNG